MCMVTVDTVDSVDSVDSVDISRSVGVHVSRVTGGGAGAGGTMGTVSVPCAEMLPHYAVIRGQSMSALTRATGQYRTPLLSVNIVPVWSP